MERASAVRIQPCMNAPQSHGRIDLDADGDFAYWVKALDTTPDELRRAIAVVGAEATAVRAWLTRGSDAELPPAGEQRPDGG
jgi:hypothetical protein